MKRFLLQLSCALLALSASARDFSYTYEGQTINYTIIDENAKTCKTKDGNMRTGGNIVSGDLVLPAHPVDGDAEYTLVSLGQYAFYRSKSLLSVTIPNSVTSISIYPFLDCELLNSINIEEGNMNYSSVDGVLYNSDKTQLLQCPIAKTGDYIVPNSVTSIERNAFQSCKELTSVVIGNSVNSIGEFAFNGCRGLQSVEIGNAVKVIGMSAFFGCEGLTSIEIPNTVTVIEPNVFNCCYGLTSVSLPNSLETIGGSAFSNCGLTSITLPKSVTQIDGTAFSYCNSLESVNVEEGNKHYCSEEGILFNADKTQILIFPNGKKGSYSFPGTITSIGDYALAGCRGLTMLTIPNSVTSIGSNAFSGCSGLTSLIIGNSVTSIGDYAFFDCSSLRMLTIPNSVTTIGNNAFEYCSELTDVIIGNSVTSIGDDIFKSCYNLKIAIPSTLSINQFMGKAVVTYPAQRSVIEDGFVYSQDKSVIYYAPTSLKDNYEIPGTVETIGENAFNSCSDITMLTIPNSVTTIGDFAFSGCSSLSMLTIPNSVTTVGNNAFENCSGLTSLMIGDAVTTIGNYAFSGCSGLTILTIPNSVTTVGDNAFELCSGLISGIIGKSVTSINGNAFTGCNNIMKIAVPSTISLTMPNRVKTVYYPAQESIIEDGIVYGSNKTAIYYVSPSCNDGFEIPGTVKTIEDGAFAFCSDLTSLFIPYSVTKIGDTAFQGCSSLSSIYLPSSLTYIGSYTFYDCKALKSITYNTKTPLYGYGARYDTFTEEIYHQAELIIPEGTLEIFRATNPWSQFLNIKEKDLSGIEEIVVDAVNGDIDYDAPYEVYNLNGVKVGRTLDGLSHGTYIIRQGGKSRKLMNF